jgi:hypothetical protein
VQVDPQIEVAHCGCQLPESQPNQHWQVDLGPDTGTVLLIAVESIFGAKRFLIRFSGISAVDHFQGSLLVRVICIKGCRLIFNICAQSGRKFPGLSEFRSPWAPNLFRGRMHIIICHSVRRNYSIIDESLQPYWPSHVMQEGILN